MDLKVGRRNQIVTVITSMSNTGAVMHFHVSRLQFDYTTCAHTGVQGWQTSPCLHHPAAARTSTQSKKAAKRAQVPGIFSESDMQVFNLLHKPTQLSRYMPWLMISSVSFLMSSGVCVKPRWKTAVHFNPPMLLTHASYIFVVLFHMLQDCGGLTPAGCQMNTKAAYHCPPQLDKEKYKERFTEQDKKRRRPLSSHHGQNRLNLRKLIYYQSKLSRKMRNKN